jgi:hypothetical protein
MQYYILNDKKSNTAYFIRRCGQKTFYMHRDVMGKELGRPLLKSERIDHIDGNGLNNDINNLRLCSPSQNASNRNPIKGKKYKGMYFTRNGKWSAQITFNYKKISLGVFTTEKEAAIAYNLKALELFGEFAKLNEIN